MKKTGRRLEEEENGRVEAEKTTSPRRLKGEKEREKKGGKGTQKDFSQQLTIKTNAPATTQSHYVHINTKFICWQ